MILKPPQNLSLRNPRSKSVFLAGSIEMGSAPNWQTEMKADYIVMYFDPQTKAPVSMLELGLFASSKKILVICPKGFWRKGNIDIVCNRFDVPIFESMEALKSFFQS